MLNPGGSKFGIHGSNLKPKENMSFCEFELGGSRVRSQWIQAVSL